jgi:hypothetical protein
MGDYARNIMAMPKKGKLFVRHTENGKFNFGLKNFHSFPLESLALMLSLE